MAINRLQIQELIKKIEVNQSKIRQLLDDGPALQKTIQEKFRIEWTYNSNALEGNTLTLGETAFFLREGLTSEGKPLKDFLEAKNHAEAIDALYEIVIQKRPLTESVIKELHAVLMKGLNFTPAKGADGKFIEKPLNPGKYKTQPNHVLTISGKIHYYAEPLKVVDEMEDLLGWLYKNSQLHPVERAAIFHYRFVCIHPFDDGNGRMARLLMNLILMQTHCYPCVIRNEKRRFYLEALEKTDVSGDYNDFILFVAEEMAASLDNILLTLEQSKVKIITKAKVDFVALRNFAREELILDALKEKDFSIGELLTLFPDFKRPNLKYDLRKLTDSGRIMRRGKGRSVVYSLRRHAE